MANFLLDNNINYRTSKIEGFAGCACTGANLEQNKQPVMKISGVVRTISNMYAVTV